MTTSHFLFIFSNRKCFIFLSVTCPSLVTFIETCVIMLMKILYFEKKTQNFHCSKANFDLINDSINQKRSFACAQFTLLWGIQQNKISKSYSGFECFEHTCCWGKWNSAKSFHSPDSFESLFKCLLTKEIRAISRWSEKHRKINRTASTGRSAKVTRVFDRRTFKIDEMLELACYTS